MLLGNMPNKKSSKKDLSKSLERRSRNRKYKSIVRTCLEKFLKNVSVENFQEVQKILQSTARKGIISRQKAARNISKSHLILKKHTNQILPG